MYVHIHLSLSLSIYIYIYTYVLSLYYVYDVSNHDGSSGAAEDRATRDHSND